MDIQKLIDGLNIKDKSHPLLAVIIKATDEIKNSGNLTEEVINNLRVPMGDFFQAKTEKDRNESLLKIAVELSLHDKISSSTKIYKKLKNVTGVE